MQKQAILHIPMSEYAHGLDEEHIVYRLRAAKGDLKKVTLFYGDTACRKTPIEFFPEAMSVAASDRYHDYWEVVVKSRFRRVYYYFELFDGESTALYYGDLFSDELVDERSEYFKLPFNHRADIARVPDWAADAVVYNIFPDSFASGQRKISAEPTKTIHNNQPVNGRLGGTLSGIAENIDYLLGLGINCVYLNPIFAAGEYHKYDLIDYYHVDPCFGGDEAFRNLVELLHQNGIRIIIDGVFNHCGWRFFAFEDVIQNQEQSQYRDWFYQLNFPVVRPVRAGDYPNYECFAYERMMPKLNTQNPEVREYFCGVGRHWVEEFHIDGWRLDVASEVDDGFWRVFRQAVKGANPEALLVGEIWESAGHWLQGDMFDSTMNYDLRKHAKLFFALGSIDAAEFSGRITNMLMRYKKQITPAQMNLLDSHDVGRFYSLCGDINRYKLAVLFQMLFVGMPTVFYGDEQGICGTVEEEYRSAMPWGGGNKELEAFFKKAIAMRNELPSLRRGSFSIKSAKEGSRLLVFTRSFEGQTVTAALNCGEQPEQLPEISGRVYWESGLGQNELGGWSFAVFVS